MPDPGQANTTQRAPPPMTPMENTNETAESYAASRFFVGLHVSEHGPRSHRVHRAGPEN